MDRQTNRSWVLPAPPRLHLSSASSHFIQLNEIEFEWTFAMLFLPSLSCPLLVPFRISHHQRSSRGQAKQPWLLGSTPTTNQQWQHSDTHQQDHTDQCRQEGMTRLSLSTASDSFCSVMVSLVIQCLIPSSKFGFEFNLWR